MSANLPPARQLARRLIDGSRSDGGSSTDSAHSAAAAFDYLYEALARWVGLDGGHALFTRALAQARTEHPSLASIKLRARSTPYLEGVTEAVEQHGAPATAAALESVLVTLIELLGRLIGDDMASNLIVRGVASSAGDDANRENRRAEA